MPQAEEAQTPEVLLGRMVRAAREARSWSQEELARRLKTAGQPIHQTGIARLESGDRGVRFNEVVALAMVLDLDLSTMRFRHQQVDDAEVAEIRRELSDIGRQISEASAELNEVEANRDQLRRRINSLTLREDELQRRLALADHHG